MRCVEHRVGYCPTVLPPLCCPRVPCVPAAPAWPYCIHMAARDRKACLLPCRVAATYLKSSGMPATSPCAVASPPGLPLDDTSAPPASDPRLPPRSFASPSPFLPPSSLPLAPSPLASSSAWPPAPCSA